MEDLLAAVRADLFVPAFVTFFVIIDPIGVAPIFASLTSEATALRRRMMAIKSVVIATFVLIGFGFGGEWLLSQLKVSLDAFRIAGGVLLFLLALDMLFEKRTERREERAEAVMKDAEEEAAAAPVAQGDPRAPDVSVFPMAIPMIAGPGAIATIMLYMKEAEGDLMGQGAVYAALGANLLLCLVLFVFIGGVMKILGDTLAAMITRILGVILAALAAQFIIDGVAGAFGLSA